MKGIIPIGIVIFLLFITLCCVLVVFKFSNDEDIDNDHLDQFCTVDTKSGRVRGKLNRTLFDQVPYYSFRGIRYGKPPIGNLRFKAPQKIDPWNGTFDAFEFGNDCLQSKPTHIPHHISEDCLYLNVYVPSDCSSMNSSTQLPVMFYIFGGRFAFNSASYFGPDFFMETNVIIVTFNYRLGPFGFLSLGLPEYSGNMGLKDQALALQWVHKNIEQFGGDKNNITLFGQSAGAISASLQILSPQANNLFSKAIMLCGTSLNSQFRGKQDHYSILSNMAASLFYPISNKNDLIEFLRQIDGQLLSKSTYQESSVSGFGRKTFSNIWVPTIEIENAIDPFLTESPFEILTNPNYKSDIDALYLTSPYEVNLITEQTNPDLLKNFDEMFQIQLPLAMAQVDFNSKVYKNISKQIREFYFNGGHVNATTLDKMYILVEDSEFIYGIILNAFIQAAKSSGRTFFSEFAVSTDLSFSVMLAKAHNLTIPWTHNDVLYYIFRSSERSDIIPDETYQNLSEDSLPRRLIKSTTEFLVNFAKFGNPIPDREPLYFKIPHSDHLYYYHITNDGIFPKKDPKRDRMQFWNKIFEDHKHLWNTTFNFHL